MVTDGELDELHEFAARLGIYQRRFQNHPRHPHYDLLPASRELALALGAVEVTTKELWRIVQQGRDGSGQAEERLNRPGGSVLDGS